MRSDRHEHHWAASRGRRFAGAEPYAISWRQIYKPPRSAAARMRALARDGLLSAAGMLCQGLGDRFVRCLYCHYVFDDQRAAFERIITRLKAMGTFVDTQTVLAMLSGERPVDGRYFHLSLDDGFRNNLTNALPILRQQSVPAIFFVPSALIGSDYERTKDYCKNALHQPAAIEVMSWDDLKAILDAGYEIGSHTRSHARLSAISSDGKTLRDEIVGSKHDLETRLGYRCRYISWPYGRVVDADAVSLACVREAGYEGCFGAFRGSVVPDATDLYRIPRHHFEPQWPLAHEIGRAHV